MCVYSVTAENSRDAKEGESLVVTQFPHARGLADPGHRGVAVCILPASSVMFRGLDNETQARLGLSRNEGEAVLEIRPARTFSRFGGEPIRNDAFVFGNGSTIDINDLPVGTYLEVLTLGVRSVPLEEVEQPVMVRA